MEAAQDDYVFLDRDDVSDFNEANILPESPASIDQILTWLKPTAYDSEGGEYRKHLASHVEGTGTWLTSTENYQKWHNSSHYGLLWLKGIPGAGKSVFAASLAERLAKEGVPVLYFFFRQIIDANHSPISLLRDWLCQILRYSPPLQARLSGYIKAKRGLESLSIDDLFKDLRLAFSHQARVYAVADALDEIDAGNEAFIRTLGELGLHKPGRFKLLLTSRPVPAVEGALRNIPSLQIRLEERLVDLDIATYVTHRLSPTSIQPKDQELIRKAVPGRANGLFLYAKLALDAFLEPEAQVQEVLEALPADLNVMYTDLLNEHARRSNLPRELQLLILQWVTHASRPLRLLELAEMLHVTSPEHSGVDLKATKALVRATCGPLIEILPDETISVIHHSFTEFLKGNTRTAENGALQEASYPVLLPGPTHASLALSCLTYLQSGPLDEIIVKHRRRGSHDYTFGPFDDKENRHSEWKLKFPFLDYASRNWYTHITKAAPQRKQLSATNHIHPKIHAELDAFLVPGLRLSGWLELVWPHETDEKVTALHIAAWADLKSYAQELLLREDVSVNAKDSKDNTALHYAAMEGHTEIVAMLIRVEDVELDADNDIGLKPLHHAASNNHAVVVKMLLDFGVNPLTEKTKETGIRRCGNAPSSVGHTPLMYACEYGHSESVHEFLPYLKSEDAHQALCWASARGHSKTVAVILNYPDLLVNELFDGRSALFEACRTLDRDTIKLLLDAGADPNQRCDNTYTHNDGMRCWAPPKEHEIEAYARGFTPMHAFAGAGSRRWGKDVDADAAESILHMLLKAGGHVDILDRNGKTPLFYASESETSRYEEITDHVLARVLLEAGADANIADKNGNTPLHSAVDDYSGSLARLLVEQGRVDLNAKGSSGRTPLLCLVRTQHVQGMLRFLQYKPDLSATDEKGNGPLHLIMENTLTQLSFGEESDPTMGNVVKMLISEGADPSLRNHDGDTPIHMLAEETLGWVSILLEAGASLEAKNHKGETALFKAVGLRRHNSNKMVPKLLDMDAKIDTVDWNGRTLLHEAVRNTESAEIFDLLLARGVDPLIKDFSGRSLLHEFATVIADASWCAPKDEKAAATIQRLVALGIDPDLADNNGCTALHLTASTTFSQPRLNRLLPIDVILKVCKKVDPKDHHAVTPLHLASTFSPVLVARLLDTGSNVEAKTFEGLTVLHLAARACQSNILGLILESLQNKGQDAVSRMLNSKDKHDRTPLHYACRSGRPESVLLLLQAGADAYVFDSSSQSALKICKEFQWEHGARECYPSPHGRIISASSVRIDDSRKESHLLYSARDWPAYSAHDFNGDADTARLEEIVDLLLDCSPSLNAFDRYERSGLDRALQSALHFGNEYAASVFDEAAKRLQTKVTGDIRASFNYLCTETRSRAARHAFNEWCTVWCKKENKESKLNVLKTLLRMRQYRLFEEIVKANDDTVTLNSEEEGLLPLLCRSGFDRLLAAVGKPELAQKFDDHIACGDMETEYCTSSVKPLLIVACERVLPNMGVVKVLVEKLGAEINALNCKDRYSHGVTASVRGTVLHELAMGREWWQVSQALPYLLDVGCNRDFKDDNGNTPLHVALDRSRYGIGYFHRQAAKLLITRGADVNAVDNSGQTCLAKAGSDRELVEALIKAGASITPDAVFAAIDCRDSKLLEAYLKAGADPNQRRPKIPGSCEEDDDLTHLPFSAGNVVAEHEVYPLYYAATQRSPGPRSFQADGKNTSEQPDPRTELVRILLEYGADPYRTFVKRRLPGEAPESVKQCTILHELIEREEIMELFLSTSLNVEARDSKGRTVLLTVCASYEGPDATINVTQEEREPRYVGRRSIVATLINHGANVRAVDGLGNNALHIMLNKPDFNYDVRYRTSVETVLKIAPDLLRQENIAGETPFHCALPERRIDDIASLLEAGADANAPDADGNTVLHHLSIQIARGNEKAKLLLTKLLNAGLSISTRNNKGETPLFSLIRVPARGKWDSVTWRSPAKDGEPSRSNVQFFLDAGADILDRNDAGESLLHILAARTYDGRFSRPDLVEDKIELDLALFKYLIDLGLDPLAEDGQQRTSLDVAAASQNSQILKLFERTSN